jgi:hypothetical protein
MTDQELADYLHLTPDEAAVIIPRLPALHRASYERMRQVEVEAELWAAGLGPKPAGVLIDTERSIRNRRPWR